MTVDLPGERLRIRPSTGRRPGPRWAEVMRPVKVMAWNALDSDATRFRFPGW